MMFIFAVWLLLQLCFTCIDALTPINHDLYHTSDGLIREIKDLVGRHPQSLNLETWRRNNKGYSAEISAVTYRSGGGDGNDDDNKYRVLLSFGQHGREIITTEVALQLLKILTGEKALPRLPSASFNYSFENLVIKVVPMENLNGRKLVEAGDRCERRNGRRVDLNRNWSVDWGKKEKDYDPYEENPGTAPFSEPESQIMRKLCASFNPHIWVNVHSGMEALFMPYDHRNTTPDGFNSDIMWSLLKDLNYLHCQGNCMVGSGGGSVGYLAHGTSTDYIYDIIKVPMAFTFEIYGDINASSNDCFKMFNPTSSILFERVLHDWTSAFLTIFVIGPRLLKQGEDIDPRFGDTRSMRRHKEMLDTIDEQDLATQDFSAYTFFAVSFVVLVFIIHSRIAKCKSILQSFI